MIAQVVFKTVLPILDERSRPSGYRESSEWEEHVIQDITSVITHAHGYISITNVEGQIFMYMLHNVLRVKVTP